MSILRSTPPTVQYVTSRSTFLSTLRCDGLPAPATALPVCWVAAAAWVAAPSVPGGWLVAATVAAVVAVAASGGALAAACRVAGIGVAAVIAVAVGAGAGVGVPLPPHATRSG